MLQKVSRSMRARFTAFYPLCIADFDAQWVVSGVTNGKKAYLCVVNLGDAGKINIPLKGAAAQVYPKQPCADIRASADGISVALPEKSAVVLGVE